MTKIKQTLYKEDSNGKIRRWEIHAFDDKHWSISGQMGGKIKVNKPTVATPKNIGRSNETTAEQQAVIEAEAKWAKKIKTGYCINIEDVGSVSFKKPMKGSLYRDYVDKVVFPVKIQSKLNGVRSQSDLYRSYSTGGETFNTVPHIREELSRLFDDHPDAFIDGEFFNFELRQHLNRLVKLVSVNIKPEHLTDEILSASKDIVQLHVFDGYGFKGITEKTPYIDRHHAVARLLSEYDLVHTKILPYGVAESDVDLNVMMNKNYDEGGEGLMVRYGDCPYKHGKSKFMLKLKHMTDDEFEIVDIQEGVGNWAGCAKRIIIKLHEPATNATKDETCASNIMGSMEELKELFDNKDEYIGQMATVRYQHMSEFGVLQLPFVVCVRAYE